MSFSSPQGIGPGVFVAVVGPSGAGKDTLMTAARAQLRGRPEFVFVTRRVTRPPSAGEDNESISWADYRTAVREGRMALAWEAHGHGYVVPQQADLDVAAGKFVVANLSRTAIPAARARYRQCFAVYIDAPVAVRAARLASRSRETAAEIADRLERAGDGAASIGADLVIDNAGQPEDAASALASFLLEAARGQRPAT